MTAGAANLVATDVGGAFTDHVYFRSGPDPGNAEVFAAQADATSPGCERGMPELLGAANADLPAVDFPAQGTTVVINATTERRGAKVGVVATEGLRHTLEIGRGNRLDFFNLHCRKPPPFVPRRLRRELPGRIGSRGEETAPPDLAPLAVTIEDFRREAVEAVAICFLHPYANPAHGRLAESEIGRLWPDVPAICSCDIALEWREYERTNTAVPSGYKRPVAQSCLRQSESGLAGRGFSGSPCVMQSISGVESFDAASRRPIAMIEFGPASGVSGAAELGKLIGELNEIALGIGGTTAKCSLVENGGAKIVTECRIEKDRKTAGYPVMVPVVKIRSGGGSFARVDDSQKLRLGSRSADAVPGPASYGRDGADATTTGANLWPGRISRDRFRGGETAAGMAAAESELAEAGEMLGAGIGAAPRGIVRIANYNMVNALKPVSQKRGFDLRDFALRDFALIGLRRRRRNARRRACEGARHPKGGRARQRFPVPGVGYDHVGFAEGLRHLSPCRPGTWRSARNRIGRPGDRRRRPRPFASEGIKPSDLALGRFGTFRCRNRERSTAINLGAEEIMPDAIPEIRERFQRACEREYAYRLDAPFEMVGIHIVASAAVGKIELNSRTATGARASAASKGARPVDFAPEGAHRAAVCDAELLEPGMEFEGSAIVEGCSSAVAMHPGNRADIDSCGNIAIRVEDEYISYAA